MTSRERLLAAIGHKDFKTFKRSPKPCAYFFKAIIGNSGFD